MVAPVAGGRRAVHPRPGTDPDGRVGAASSRADWEHAVNILAAIDFSGFTEPILGAVQRIAAAAPETRVWLLHVAEPDPSFVGYDAGPSVVRDQVAAEYRREHQKLQACAERLRRNGAEVSALLIQGAIVDTILTEAVRLDVQLIVMGLHGYGAIAE